LAHVARLKGAGNGQALLKPVPEVSGERPPWWSSSAFRRALEPDSRLRPSGSVHRYRSDHSTAKRVARISHSNVQPWTRRCAAAENLDALRLVASSPTRTLEALMNQYAVVSKFSHVASGKW